MLSLSSSGMVRVMLRDWASSSLIREPISPTCARVICVPASTSIGVTNRRMPSAMAITSRTMKTTKVRV